MTIAQSLLVVLFAPLVSAALICFFLRGRGVLASYLSVGTAAVIVFFSWWAWSGAGGESVAVSRTWLELGQFHIDLGFLFDGVAATMLLMVAFVGFLIHVFSLGYMQADKARARFFGGLSIFMFSMLGIVLADNLIMIFIFWELVGFSSYMLIGHYMETEAAKEASKRLSLSTGWGTSVFSSVLFMHIGSSARLTFLRCRQSPGASGDVELVNSLPA